MSLDEVFQAKIGEVQRELDATKTAVTRFIMSDTNPDKRDAWEAFLFSFSRSMGKVIAIGLLLPETKAIAHKLKNDSHKNDPGLVYLREARNVSEHGLEPSAHFKEAFTSIGNGAIIIEGNSTNVVFEGNSINGRPMGDFELDTAGGKPSRIDGHPNTSIEFSPARVVLVRVKNPEKKTSTFFPPSSIFGKEVAIGDAQQLAKHALEGLSEIFSDMKRRMLGSKP